MMKTQKVKKTKKITLSDVLLLNFFPCFRKIEATSRPPKTTVSTHTHTHTHTQHSFYRVATDEIISKQTYATDMTHTHCSVLKANSLTFVPVEGHS